MNKLRTASWMYAMPMWNYTESTQWPKNQLLKCMPKYTVHFFITYWKKGKAVSIHAVSTNRV